FVHKRSQNERPPADAGGRLAWSGPLSFVALSQFWSNKTVPERQNETSVTGVTQVLLSPVPQRGRTTHTLRAEVVEHYAAGMSCRRVAAALGLGRTTVLQILKAAGIEVRPQGRKY